MGSLDDGGILMWYGGIGVWYPNIKETVILIQDEHPYEMIFMNTQ